MGEEIGDVGILGVREKKKQNDWDREGEGESGGRKKGRKDVEEEEEERMYGQLFSIIESNRRLCDYVIGSDYTIGK